MATSVVAEKGEINNMWADLEDVPNGRILMSLSWLATTKDKSVLQGEKYWYTLELLSSIQYTLLILSYLGKGAAIKDVSSKG